MVEELEVVEVVEMVEGGCDGDDQVTTRVTTLASSPSPPLLQSTQIYLLTFSVLSSRLTFQPARTTRHATNETEAGKKREK